MRHNVPELLKLIDVFVLPSLFEGISNTVLEAMATGIPAVATCVGSNPHPKVRDLENIIGVTVTGFVEDIRPYYKAADIGVIPLRMARGIQNKVREAMAMRKPVVATTKAIEGIHAMPNKHVLVEDTARDFAKAVSKLMKNQELRNRLGAAAREFVLKKYDWHTNMKKFEHLLFPPQTI